MNVFVALHKSIFSGEFYKGVIGLTAGGIIKFLLLVCLGTALISGISHLYYVVGPSSNLDAEISQAFGGIELDSGLLRPHRPLPYIPDNAHVSKAFAQLFFIPQSSAFVPDSFVIIDTSASALRHVSSSTMFLLTGKRLVVNPGSKFSYDRPYNEITGKLHVTVSKESVRKLLVHLAGFLAVFYCIWAGITNAGVYFLSILFLAFIAYIFRIERKRSLSEFVAMACFAASPVYIGTNIVAISGTTVSWTWHVFILISTFVMFRGVQSTSQISNRTDN